jgi:hypothetical protein
VLNTEYEEREEEDELRDETTEHTESTEKHGKEHPCLSVDEMILWRARRYAIRPLPPPVLTKKWRGTGFPAEDFQEEDYGECVKREDVRICIGTTL